jgi:DNA-binding response OmpR family regulator
MKLRALIFEEVESLRNLLAVALRDRNYEVYSFADPQVCPLYDDKDGACPQELPCADLLITDNHFAGTSGLQLIRRHVEGGCKGAVSNTAVMSDSWTHEELELARELGCKVFEKPFRFKDFSNWLDNREKTVEPDRRLAEVPHPPSLP